MLKIRVMPTLLYRDSVLVKGIGFDSWRNVGSAMQAVRVYNMRNVDELVFLDITATRQSRGPDLGLVRELAQACFMPFAVGGGITKVEDVRWLLNSGADKVVVNTAMIDHPNLVGAIAEAFGSQSVVASIDAKADPTGGWEVWVESGTRRTGLDPVSLARRAEAEGVGEIMICSIEQDGTQSGYDTRLVQAISDAVAIPVIASGGAGRFEDFARALDAGASAVAAASMFHFTEQTPMEAKHFLAKEGYPVRL